MICRHIEDKLYKKYIAEAKWFSPIQNVSCQNIFLLTEDSESLVFAYSVYDKVAIISLAFSSEGIHNSLLLRTALDNLIIDNHELTELVIYLINESDISHLKNEIYAFTNLGVFFEGLKDTRGIYHDLYLFGCSVEVKLPSFLSDIDFNLTSFPQLLNTKLSILYGDKTAISYTERGNSYKISYCNLPQMISNLADRLSLSHIKNIRIALIGENSPYWLLSCLAILCSGCTLVLIDNKNIDMELVHKCPIVLSGGQFYLELDLNLSLNQKHKRLEDICKNMLDCFNSSVSNFPFIHLNDDALIASTSGTSGAGKHVLLTHGNIMSSLAHIALSINKHVMTGCEVVFPCMPPYHAYSIVCGFFAPLLYGAKISFGSIDHDNLIYRFSEVNPTTLITVPSIMKTLGRCIRNGVMTREKPKLRFAVVGGSRIDSNLVQIEKELGIPLLCGYGLTECTSFVYCDLIKNGLIYPDTESLNSCFSHLKIRDGCIEIFGRVVAKGYFEGKQFQGYLKTSDLAHFEDNRLCIDGRADNTIVLPNGYKLLPEIVEKKLYRYSSILEARVYGFKRENLTLLAAQVVVKDFASKETAALDIANYNKSVSFYERIVQIIYENEDMVERTALGKLRYVNSFKE